MSNVQKLTRIQTPLYVGDDGVLQTLLEMERLTLRDAKELQMRQTVGELKADTDTKTIENIYNFVWQNWRYKSDPDTEEHLTAPIHLLNNCGKLFGCKHVDCDDYSMLLACLLTAAGYSVAFRVLSWRNKNFTHVYVMVDVPSQNAWMPLDPVLKSKGLWKEKPRGAHNRTLTFPVGKTMETMMQLRQNLQNPATATMGDIMSSLASGERDIFGQIIQGVVQGKPVLDVAKDAAQAGCEAVTDGYIKKQQTKIIIACVGAGIAGLAAGVAATYFAMRD